MRRFSAALCLGLLVATTLPAQADEVAVLDWRAALMQTDAAERSMTALGDRLADRQQQVQALGEELQQMQQRLQDESTSMTETERRTTLQAFQRQGRRFESLRREIAEARRQAEQSFLEQAEPKLDRAVRQVIERHEVAVLVDPNGVLYADQDLQDLTGEVTVLFNTLQ